VVSLFKVFILILWHIDPLLGNERETNNETTAIAMQQLRKCPTVLEHLLSSGPSATMVIMLEAVFYICSAQRIYHSTDSVEVALRVAGGDEKGSLESETVKIWSRVPQDLDPKMTALAMTRNNCKRQTRPPSERALNVNKPGTV
jgi:hypothetical protein